MSYLDEHWNRTEVRVLPTWWVAARTNPDVPTDGAGADLAPLEGKRIGNALLEAYRIDDAVGPATLDIELLVEADSEEEARDGVFRWVDQLCANAEWLRAAGVYNSGDFVSGNEPDWSEAPDVFSIVGMEERNDEGLAPRP
jgi:hypothetical protein